MILLSLMVVFLSVGLIFTIVLPEKIIHTKNMIKMQIGLTEPKFKKLYEVRSLLEDLATDPGLINDQLTPENCKEIQREVNELQSLASQLKGNVTNGFRELDVDIRSISRF